MSTTNVSTKPCLHEPRPGESRGWDDEGLVEAALEGRLGRHDGTYSARARTPALDAAPATRAVGSGPVPLHVPGTASQVPTVRLIETSRPIVSPGVSLRAKLIRAVGFLAVILGTLVLADFLQS